MPDVLDRLKTALADRYTLQRELGRGGMATVYLADDLKHHRPVALKVLKPELAAVLGPERFLREIELSARLTHPHILPLHDSGNADGFLYYVMPYVEGESLRDRLSREKQLPLDDALQISREVADALSYAHSHGVIHRDIKPENILLESGHAVVADFGIAKAIAVAGDERLTETGLAIGTPAYMSPEQAAGNHDLDGRSDLYSLGCVLYEMLSGETPYTGPTPQAILAKKLGEPLPHISVVRKSIPGTVEEALAKMLARTPADRYRTAAAFAEAISQQAAAAPPTRPWKMRAGLLGLTAMVVMAGAVAVSLWMRPGATGSRHPRTAIAVLPFENLSSEGPNAYFAGSLHDELLTQLAKVAALKVISRTSVMTYARSPKTLKEIADELAVGAIVEGTVQAVGERLRVNVQLIDAATDQHLWAEQYDRTLDDGFAIQSDIAQRVVAAVGAALTGAEAVAITAAPTENAEAYRLYLQGLDYWNRPDKLRQDLEVAQRLYERALTLDPDFALAYAALSMIHGTMYWYAYDPRPSRLASQRAAAEAALHLAPELPQAHRAMVFVHYYGELDYAKALEEATVALERLPGADDLWGVVGYLHRRLGHWDEVLAAFKKATALDPRDVGLLTVMGGDTFRFLKQYEDAIEAFDRALELAPDYHGAELRRAWTYLLWHGELDTLRQVLEHAPESFGDYGSSDRWRVRLALWERKPDVVLAVLGAPALVTFEARLGYEPGLLYAGWAHQLRGDRAAASRAFTGALAQLDTAPALPEDWRLQASRGLALAALGRQREAKREAARLTRSPVYADLFTRPVLDEARAMIFAQAGLVDEALAEIEPLLARPSWTSAPMMRLDPRWDPIRKDPRFQVLLVKYAEPEAVK
jgi:serine/threonine-protein kinase